MKDLTPATIHAAAVAALPASDIDHHASDLYIKVTPASQQLLNRFQYRHIQPRYYYIGGAGHQVNHSPGQPVPGLIS